MRHKYGRSPVVEKATFTVPVTRGLNASFLGAISPQGCNNQQRPIKRKNLTEVRMYRKATTANHLYYFIKSIIQEVKENPELGDLKYLITAEAVICNC